MMGEPVQPFSPAKNAVMPELTARPGDDGLLTCGEQTRSQGALVDPQVTSDFGDRLAGLEHHLHGFSLDLRAERPPLLGHGRILSACRLTFAGRTCIGVIPGLA